MKLNLFYAIIAALFLVGCGEGGSGDAAKGIGSDGGGVSASVPAGINVEKTDGMAASSGNDNAN